MTTRRRWIIFLLLSVLALVGCSKSKTLDSAGPRMGTLSVRMTDAPGDFEAIHLVVREVAVHAAFADTDSTEGWQVLSTTPATYDLLTLRNGVFAALGTSVVPAVQYDQVRLKLGAGSDIVVGGVTYPLTVPSGMQSGLKLVGGFTVAPGGTTDIGIDFDAARSVLLTGSGTWMLKPVVRVVPVNLAGAISGAVLPGGTAATVYAITSAETLGTAAPAADGSFLIPLLPAGTYSLGIHPAATYRDTSLAGIAVTAGNTTLVGNVQLTAK